MGTKSILLSKYLSLAASILLAGSRLAAADNLLTFFSAEQDDFRRLMIDGVGNRQVQVVLDSSGTVAINVLGVDRQSYVGQLNYRSGFLIPVDISVEFPRHKNMLINVSGNKFTEIVKYRVVNSGVYIIDMYTSRIPRESVFREETIGALWPEGRFQPDITPTGKIVDNISVAATHRFELGKRLLDKIYVYRYPIVKAIFWAGAVFGALLITSLPLLLLLYFRSQSKAGRKSPVDFDGDMLNSTRMARNLMRSNDGLSFEEATLMAELGRD